MRIIFLGSGDFACPIVDALHAHGWLMAAVTQPDRPAGRNRKLTPCPVRRLLQARGLDALTPEKIGDAVDALQALRPDLLVVTDYGQYIPSRVINVAPLRAINVHPSLLPKYRGAAPIPWAIAHGDAETGVSIQYVEKRMDSGDLLMQERFVIGGDETAPELETRLSREGARMITDLIPRLAAGSVKAVAQDEAAATHARKMAREDGSIDWNADAELLRNRIRAFQPWPGQTTLTPRGRLKILKAQVEVGSNTPGQVLDVGDRGPRVATGRASLRLLEVQPEGKNTMSGADYVRGSRLQPGEVWTPLPQL